MPVSRVPMADPAVVALKKNDLSLEFKFRLEMLARAGKWTPKNEVTQFDHLQHLISSVPWHAPRSTLLKTMVFKAVSWFSKR